MMRANSDDWAMPRGFGATRLWLQPLDDSASRQVIVPLAAKQNAELFVNTEVAVASWRWSYRSPDTFASWLPATAAFVAPTSIHASLENGSDTAGALQSSLNVHSPQASHHERAVRS
jgi:hypothetical protein